MAEQYYRQCPRCGTLREEAVRFCRHCGAALEVPPYFRAYPATRSKRWVLPLVLGGAGLLVLIIVVVAVSYFRNMLGYAPSKVVCGAPLAWRSLAWIPDPTCPPSPFMATDPFRFAALAIGDFDGDKDDELYVNCSMYGSNLLELDGAGRFIPQNTYFHDLQPCGWDYDSDGVDELLSIAQSGTDMAIYDRQGKFLAQLRGGGAAFSAVCGDIDGDGRSDLVLLDQPAQDVLAYAPGGKQLWQSHTSLNTFVTALGDVDGDGRSELVTPDGNQLRLSGMQQQDQFVPGWAGWELPVAVLDLDGDKRGEVFCSNISYLNLATGKTTTLRYGKTGQRRSTDAMAWVHLARLPGSAQPCLATIGLNNFNAHSELFLLDTSGNCSYEERFGAPVEKFGVARKADGSDCLVVLTSHKLLVYP